MKKIYSTPVSIETKTRIRASILAGSNTPSANTPQDITKAEELKQNEELGARTRFGEF